MPVVGIPVVAQKILKPIKSQMRLVNDKTYMRRQSKCIVPVKDKNKKAVGLVAKL